MDFPLPLALTTRYECSGIPPSRMSISAGALCLQFQNEGFWNPKLEVNTTHDPFPTVPSHSSSDITSHTSYNSFPDDEGHSLLNTALGISGQPAEGKKAQKYRPLVAKHTGSSTMEFDAVARNNISSRNSKKGGRKRNLNMEERRKAAEMRKRTACVRCSRNRTTVSSNTPAHEPY